MDIILKKLNKDTIAYKRKYDTILEKVVLHCITNLGLTISYFNCRFDKDLDYFGIMPIEICKNQETIQKIYDTVYGNVDKIDFILVMYNPSKEAIDSICEKFSLEYDKSTPEDNELNYYHFYLARDKFDELYTLCKMMEI